MDHSAVLDVAPLTDFDGLDISPQNTSIPDAGKLSERDVAHHHSPWRDKRICVYVSLNSEVTTDSFRAHIKVEYSNYEGRTP